MLCVGVDKALFPPFPCVKSVFGSPFDSSPLSESFDVTLLDRMTRGVLVSCSFDDRPDLQNHPPPSRQDLEEMSSGVFAFLCMFSIVRYLFFSLIGLLGRVYPTGF